MFQLSQCFWFSGSETERGGPQSLPLRNGEDMEDCSVQVTRTGRSPSKSEVQDPGGEPTVPQGLRLALV